MLGKNRQDIVAPRHRIQAAIGAAIGAGAAIKMGVLHPTVLPTAIGKWLIARLPTAKKSQQ